MLLNCQKNENRLRFAANRVEQLRRRTSRFFAGAPDVAGVRPFRMPLGAVGRVRRCVDGRRACSERRLDVEVPADLAHDLAR